MDSLYTKASDIRACSYYLGTTHSGGRDSQTSTLLLTTGASVQNKSGEGVPSPLQGRYTKLLRGSELPVLETVIAAPRFVSHNSPPQHSRVASQLLGDSERLN